MYACIAVRPGKVVLVHTPTAAAAAAEATVCAAINPLLSDLKVQLQRSTVGVKKKKKGKKQRAMTTEGRKRSCVLKAAFEF